VPVARALHGLRPAAQARVGFVARHAWFEAPVDLPVRGDFGGRRPEAHSGQERRYIEIMWQQHRIWGVTAAIINNLSRRIDWHG